MFFLLGGHGATGFLSRALQTKNDGANACCRFDGGAYTTHLRDLLPPCLRASRGSRLSGPAEAGNSGVRFRSVLSGQQHDEGRELWRVPLYRLVHLWCCRLQTQRGGLIVAWGTRPRSTGKQPLCPDGALHLFQSLRQSMHVCDAGGQPFLVGQDRATRALPGPTMSCACGASTRWPRGRPGLG